HEGRRDRAAGAVRLQTAGRFCGWPCSWLPHGDWRTYGVPAAFPLRGHRATGGDVRPDSAATCRELRSVERLRDTTADGAPAVHDSLDPELLADFGHLLRNQLNAIVGAAGLLSATATSSDQRELASVVLTGSEELAGIVDEVLDSPPIQSGTFELALPPFHVRGSVESCLARLAGIPGSKGISLSHHAADDVPRVLVGASRRLEQGRH